MRTASALLVLGSLSCSQVASGQDAVSTFESIGLAWAVAAGAEDNECAVSYRRAGDAGFREGYPLWFDSRDGGYRGSLVHLTPGTTYEVELRLSSGESARLTARTWTEDPPIAKTVVLPEHSAEPLEITEGGSAGGYVLYTHAPGAGATINVANQADAAISVRASYVILRGLTVRGASRHGVRLYDVTDVIIEECDISGWGRIESDGWGENSNMGIYSREPSLARVVVQRNRIHDPRSDSNSWGEIRPKCAGAARCHPEGPQAVGFVNSAGNHVIRSNDIWGDDDHYFNDAIGAGSNFSFEGFPNRDSDIYANRISHAWDDGIEAEGANANVRIWGNFIDRTYVKIAIAGTSVGPLYVFRNVAARSSRDDVVISDDSDRGVFLKAGGETRGGTFYGGGRTYVFHNTVLQPAGPSGSTYELGCSTGVADSGGTMVNLITRNNILHHYRRTGTSLDDDSVSPTNDWDWDLYSGGVEGAPGQERNGIRGVPVYDPVHGDGWYTLDPSSPGFGDGIPLSGFNDDFAGKGPDRGAHEAGARRMEFGVDAHRSTGAWPRTGWRRHPYGGDRGPTSDGGSGGATGTGDRRSGAGNDGSPSH